MHCEEIDLASKYRRTSQRLSACVTMPTSLCCHVREGGTLNEASGLFSVPAIALVLLPSTTVFHAFRTPFDIIFIISGSLMYMDCNNVLVVANGAETVPAADVLAIGYGYKGLRPTLQISPHVVMKLQLFTVP
jgi:hypothetical protein